MVERTVQIQLKEADQSEQLLINTQEQVQAPANDKITLEIAPNKDIGEDGGEVDVNVRINVPEAVGPRVPADFCCLVDVSGSMCSAARNENCDQSSVDDGFSVLDIVKHAINSVMHILDENDRVSLVTFSDDANVLFPLTHMTTASRNTCKARLASQTPSGRTNLWAGVHTAMETLRDPDNSNNMQMNARRKVILLLTDGEPTVGPASYQRELRNYMDEHPKFSFQMNTFGFGYTLDSELLLELAQECRGTYSFIPVAPNVGTVFVNTVANVLSNCTQGATLRLSPGTGAAFTGPILGDHLSSDETWGKFVHLGPLQHGQARDVAVQMKVPAGSAPYLEAVLSYPDPRTGKEKRATSTGASRSATFESVVGALIGKTVSVGFKVIQEADNCNEEAANQLLKALDDHTEVIYNATGKPNEIAALKADISGRMLKAVDTLERYFRWGSHYLRGLLRAHQLQQCTNFLDPGLQEYGGERFAEYRENG